MVTKFRMILYKTCLILPFPEEYWLMQTIGSRKSGKTIGLGIGSQEEEEDGREYAKLRIPPIKLGWARDNKFFGRRNKGPHGCHAHPRRKRLTARRKPQAREMNRQYRPFGKKACEEAWKRDASLQYRRLLLEARPDLKLLWRVVDSDDEPLSEIKKSLN